MYNVKLKTGLSPSADDHSISEPQKKRGTYAFKLLKKYGALLQKVVLSVLGTRSLTWVWPKSSGTRRREIR